MRQGIIGMGRRTMFGKGLFGIPNGLNHGRRSSSRLVRCGGRLFLKGIILVVSIASRGKAFTGRGMAKDTGISFFMRSASIVPGYVIGLPQDQATLATPGIQGRLGNHALFDRGRNLVGHEWLKGMGQAAGGRGGNGRCRRGSGSTTRGCQGGLCTRCGRDSLVVVFFFFHGLGLDHDW